METDTAQAVDQLRSLREQKQAMLAALRAASEQMKGVTQVAHDACGESSQLRQWAQTEGGNFSLPM